MSGRTAPKDLLVLALALAVRIAPILLADRLTADVLMYHRVGESVVAGEWNPYELKGLYPYPPVWVWFEAGSAWLAARIGVSFPILVKLPVLAGDLAIVALLLRWRPRGALVYALHPVSVLVTGFHGQFDALMLFFVLLALRLHESGHPDRSALALSVAIGLKAFPVLLLPLFLSRAGGPRGRAHYAFLATAPVALILLPFALADFPAMRRELLGYGGIADFGWIALVRGARWLATGALARSEARHWGAMIPVAKALFLSVYGALVLGFWTGRLRLSLPQAALGVFLAFEVFYGAVSAQYLLWVVPLALLAMDGFFAAYTVVATAALLGFYAFLQPLVLQADPPLVRYAPGAAGGLWVAGVAATLSVGFAWLAALMRRGLRPSE